MDLWYVLNQLGRSRHSSIKSHDTVLQLTASFLSWDILRNAVISASYVTSFRKWRLAKSTAFSSIAFARRAASAQETIN